MSLSIRTNMSAMRGAASLTQNTRRLSASFEKISTGQRINRAGDDAAALAVAERLDANHRSSSQAMRNANDGISALQIAEGATDEIAEILKRIRELAVQGGNSLVPEVGVERGYMIAEHAELTQEIGRIARSTEFAGTKLLEGGAAITLQVGVGDSGSSQVSFTPGDLTISTLGSLPGVVDITDGTYLSTVADSQDMIDAVDAALQRVSDVRSQIGAVHNRLSSALASMEKFSNGIKTGESRIRDADFAQETAEMTRINIMQQAGTAITAQANQLGSVAVSLLR